MGLESTCSPLMAQGWVGGKQDWKIHKCKLAKGDFGIRNWLSHRKHHVPAMQPADEWIFNLLSASVFFHFKETPCASYFNIAYPYLLKKAALGSAADIGR